MAKGPLFYVVVVAAFAAAITVLGKRQAKGLDGCLSLSEAREGGGGKRWASYRLVNGRKCWFTTQAQHRDILALREPNRYRPRRDNHPPKEVAPETPPPLPPTRQAEPPVKVERVRPSDQMRLDEAYNELSVDLSAADLRKPLLFSRMREAARAGASAASASVRAAAVGAAATPGPQWRRLGVAWLALFGAAGAAAYLVRLLLRGRRARPAAVTYMQDGRRLYRFGWRG